MNKRISIIDIVAQVLLILLVILGVVRCRAAHTQDEIRALSRSGTIECYSVNNEKKCFWRVTSYCLDSELYIYIIDSGLNQILVFNQNLDWIGSYGRQGQGPGEFMGNPSCPLDIVYGNDGKFYVADAGNRRVSIFSKEFEFLSSAKMPDGISDVPQVNSSGDLYFLSNGTEGSFINRYDKNLNLKASFFKRDLHEKSKYFKIAKIPRSIITKAELRKAIAKDNNLVVCSNFSLKIYIYDDKNELVRSFEIKDRTFISDFKKRIKKLEAEKRPLNGGKVGPSAIMPFYLHLDSIGNIYLGYWNSSIENFELYCYSSNGEFICIYRFPEQDKVVGPFLTDGRSRFYAVSSKRTALNIYEYKSGGVIK